MGLTCDSLCGLFALKARDESNVQDRENCLLFLRDWLDVFLGHSIPDSAVDV